MVSPEAKTFLLAYRPELAEPGEPTPWLLEVSALLFDGETTIETVAEGVPTSVSFEEMTFVVDQIDRSQDKGDGVTTYDVRGTAALDGADVTCTLVYDDRELTQHLVVERVVSNQ